MTILHAVIFGIIEGVTEFLPISSTAHLIIASKITQVAQTDVVKFFEVFIQSGAVAAVVFVYFQYVLKHRSLLKHVSISFVPTAVVGFFFYKIIKNIFFDSMLLIVIALFVIGVLFLLLEYGIKTKKVVLQKSCGALTFWDAIIIGIAQSLAIIPGVSRAGIVMLYMMFAGYKRDESAIYSFLLAVPTIFAASLFDVYKMRSVLVFSQQQTYLVSIGFLVSFVTAYVVIRWFIAYLKKNSLSLFGIYRIALAIIVTVFL